MPGRRCRARRGAYPWGLSGVVDHQPLAPGRAHAHQIQNQAIGPLRKIGLREVGLVAQDIEIRKADLEDVFLDVMAQNKGSVHGVGASA